MHHRNRWMGIAAAAALFLAASSAHAQAAGAGDTALFSTNIPPNVMLLVDNSGSMHHVVWHPAYDPTVTPTCRYWDDNTQYLVHPSVSDTFPSGAGDTSWRSGTYTISSPGCVTTPRETFDDPEVTATGDYTRWDGRYLNWYFSSAADPYYSQIVNTTNGQYSPCVIAEKGLSGSAIYYPLYKRTRVRAAKVILREVICQVNAAGEVRFGLAQFRRGSDPNGGYVTVPINDYYSSPGVPNVYSLNGVTQSHGDHLDDAIDSLTGEAWTPLAESLFQIYTYFMSRTVLPPGATSGTFPAYSYGTSRTSGSGGPDVGSSSAPGAPVTSNCQKNFVIIITDGEPTMDTFATNSPTNTAQGFSNFGNLIGDYNADGEVETGYPSNGTLWLDDIAKFMHDKDFRPDLPAYNGAEQTLDVYTVGFTTSPMANSLLSKTATVGNGQFYFSNDPGKLAADIVGAVSDIIQKSQSFTAATVPAARTAAGGKFYTSLFVPSDASGYWEGHLKAWEITSTGKILDSNGNCALNDPLAPTECSSGSFLSTAVPYWDAGQRLTAGSVAGRRLFTSLNPSSGVYQKELFKKGNLSPTDLTLSTSDIPTYDYGANPVPADVNALRDVIVDNVRGCQLGTTTPGCPKRTWLLGDIFHSDPVVVPGPFAFLPDGGYLNFKNNRGTRPRVIVGGANDGFLHIFDAGVWDASATPPTYTPGQGDEVAGFAPYTARKNVKELARDSGARDFYFADGSPSVADVWFYTNTTDNTHLASGSEWRTVLVAGMRQGGNQLYALDITNPENAVSNGACNNSRSAADTGYPCYLWEFPREDDTTLAPFMGMTFSQPVITKIRVKVNSNDNGGKGFDRFVAIFGAGYAPASDPNDHASYDALSTQGRAIFVVDVQTGKVIAMKQFDATTTPTSGTDPTTISYDSMNPERSMHFGFAATPGVYDLDDDGYADVIYAPDLGGNIWKWVIDGIAVDSANSATPDYDQNGSWDFSLFFHAPSYLDSGTGERYYKSFFFNPAAVQKSGNLWLAIGSGERMNLLFPGFPSTTAENNRFYSIIERDPRNANGVAAPLTESDLLDLTSNTTCGDVASVADGFYFIGEDGEKFITEVDIFYYVALAASYVPTASASPCDTSGLSKLYAFKVTCGEGLFTDAVTGNPAPAITVGTGMPTAPQVTITTDPNGKSKIIINNQDGELIDPSRPPCTNPPCPPPPCQNSPCPSLCPLPCGFGRGAGQLYWREF